jgi:hypothetical protein
MFKSQLIVGEENKGPAVLDKFISDPRIGMTGGNGGYIHGFNGKTVFAGLMVGNIRLNLLEIHRKVGGRHDFGDHLFYGVLSKGTAKHVNGRFLPVDRFKKGKSQNMIPMGMGKNHIVLKSFFFQQSAP